MLLKCQVLKGISNICPALTVWKTLQFHNLDFEKSVKVIRCKFRQLHNSLANIQIYSGGCVQFCAGSRVSEKLAFNIVDLQQLGQVTEYYFRKDTTRSQMSKFTKESKIIFAISYDFRDIKILTFWPSKVGQGHGVVQFSHLHHSMANVKF